MKKIAVYIVFLIGVFANSQVLPSSRFQVKGLVKEKETYNPIPEVNVYVVGGDYTTTNALGEFILKVKLGDELIVENQEIKRVKYIITSKESIEVFVEGYQEKKELVKYRSSKGGTHQQYIDSALFYKRIDINKSLEFIEKSLTFLSKKGDHAKTALSFAVLGEIYMYYRQYDLAISNLNSSLRENYKDAVKLRLAQAQFLNKNYREALQTYQDLKVSKTTISYQKTEIFEGLGDTYKALQQIEQSRTAYQTALKIAQENLITPKITDLNSKLAAVYAQENNITKAETLYSNSLKLASQENVKRAVREKEKVADFYNDKNLYDKEIELRKSTLQQVEELNEEVIEPVANFLEADTITSQKINYKIANAYIAQDEYKTAIPYLEKSIAEADKKQDLVIQKDATRKLSEVYKSTGNFSKALETYQNYVELVDALYVKKEQELSRAARFSRDLALKQNRITSLEQERELSKSKYNLAVTSQQLTVESNKRQQIIIYSLLLGILLLAITVWMFYRSNKQQKLANNLLALKSLRSQMNPHFIFNALNSVNNFIAKNDERSANRYLTDFSILMRAVLENSEEDFIPLEKEIELLQLYVKLEHSRFLDKFDYTFTVNNAIDISLFTIPPMLLQPYVENAIWHGLRYREEKGHLSIVFQERDTNTIIIIIEDNGIGRVQSAKLKTSHQQKQKSKGMGNIKKRIAILNTMYKDKVDVHIEDINKDATGTRVILTLKKD